MTARDWFTRQVERELGKRNRQISLYQIQMSGLEVQDSESEPELKLVSKQTNKASLFFLFQNHHQLEVIAPSSFLPPSFYPSKLFVSFLIYIMLCSLLTTPFIRFPSTLSSPANINITMTSCLYLIQQQVKKSLVFDTVTSITWASTQFAQL